MQNDQRLTLTAAKLARTAPSQWRDFLEAFRNYTTTSTDNLIRSPLSDLPVAQGRAKECYAMLALLANCLDSADKIERSKK